MSPKNREELRKFEQRMHDKGSDGFADGPRPWEHWDESGNQASNRVWEGSARRIYGSRSAHSLGHRLLSFLAFLALTTLLVGIGGVYYSHTQTQQLAQQGVQPLPLTSRTQSVRTAPEPIARAETTTTVDELNVLTAPAAGSGSTGMAPLMADVEMPGADPDSSTGLTATETIASSMASAEAVIEEPEAVTANQSAPPPADGNIDSVAIETIVTEKSVTTTVYTRKPQQEEPELIAAIETTPPPFVHEVTSEAVTAATETDSTVAAASTMATEEALVEDTEGMDEASEVPSETVESQDMLTLTSPGTETLTEETETAATATTGEDIAIMTPAEMQADAAKTTMDSPASTSQDTAALVSPEAETAVDESVAAAADVTNLDLAASLVPTDTIADAAAEPAAEEPTMEVPATEEATQFTLAEPASTVESTTPAEPAPEETTVEAPAAEETTRIALAEPASAVESSTPAGTAQASTADMQPIMPVVKQGGWVINLASYTWKSMANKKLALFRDKGVDAEVFEVMIKDKPMYRVRVTGFASSRAAKAEVPSIEQALDLEGAWISRR